jgi:hypothetical protein
MLHEQSIRRPDLCVFAQGASSGFDPGVGDKFPNRTCRRSDVRVHAEAKYQVVVSHRYEEAVQGEATRQAPPRTGAGDASVHHGQRVASGKGRALLCSGKGVQDSETFS